MLFYKYIDKVIVTTFVTATLLLTPIPVSATTPEQNTSFLSALTPFIGLDVGNSKTALQKNYGDKIFRKKATFYNLFTGLNFNEYFGMELGYQRDNKRQATRTLGTGDYCPGGAIILAAMNPIVFETSLRMKNTYLGATLQYPIFDKAKITALFGVARATIDAKHTIVSVHGIVQSQQQIQDNLYARAYKKSKFIPMLRLGAKYQLNEKFALRGGVTWLGTARIKINSDQNGQPRPNLLGQPSAPNNSIRLKNSLNYSAGIVFNWL